MSGATRSPLVGGSGGAGDGGWAAFLAGRAQRARDRRPATIDRFVDSVNGSDSNDGLSPSTPWATLAKIPATANLKVGLARGSVFRENASIKADGQVLVDYGPLDKPQPAIKGSREYFSFGWVLDDATAGRWKLTGITNPGVPAGKAFYDDLGELLPVTSAAAVTPGKFWCDTANTTLYVALPDRTSPNGRSIEVTDRSSFGLINSKKAGAKLLHVAVRHWAAQSVLWQPNQGTDPGTVSGCEIGPSGHDGLAASGPYPDLLTGGLFEDNLIRGTWNGVPYGGSSPQGNGLRIEGVGTEVRFNIISDCYVGLVQQQGGGNHIHHNFVIRSKVNGINHYMGVVDNPTIIDHNFIWHRPFGAAGHGIVCQDSGDSLLLQIPTIRDNVVISDFLGVATNVQCLAVAGGPRPGGDIRNNLAWIMPGSTAFYGKLDGGNYATAAAWSTALQGVGVGGANVGGLQADPLLRTRDNGAVTLLPGSPAIGAGHDGSDLGPIPTV